MTYIVEEARALLAKSAKLSPHPWRLREEEADFEVCDARDEGVAEALTTEDAALIAAAPRLLAALADECERLRAENARLREAVDAARNLVSLVDARGGLGYRNHEQLSEAVARLDAAKGVL